MKKYKPIDEVLKVYDVPKELWESESLMKEKPNWNKTNYTESEKIYQNKEFIILKVKSNKKIGFIVYNTKKECTGDGIGGTDEGASRYNGTLL